MKKYKLIKDMTAQDWYDKGFEAGREEVMKKMIEHLEVTRPGIDLKGAKKVVEDLKPFRE